MEAKFKIMGITFELHDGFNLKCKAMIGETFICAFNCGTKYEDTAKEFIENILAKTLTSNKCFLDVVKEESHTIYTEEELEEFL